MGERHEQRHDLSASGDHPPIELVATLYVAFADGDHASLRRCFADDLRWRQAASVVPAAGEEVVGADDVIDRVLRPLETEWTTFTEDVGRIVGAGSIVVATGTYRGEHATTGRSLAAEFCHLWRVEGGLVRTFRQYTDTAAFAAVFDAE